MNKKEQLLKALEQYQAALVTLNSIYEQSDIEATYYPLDESFPDHTYKMVNWAADFIQELKV